jgi:hypothetical protein
MENGVPVETKDILSFRNYVTFHRMFIYKEHLPAAMELITAIIVNFFGVKSRLFSHTVVVMALLLYLSQAMEDKLDHIIPKIEGDIGRAAVSFLEDMRYVLHYANLNTFILLLMSLISGFALVYFVRIVFYVKILVLTVHLWQLLEPMFEWERKIEERILLYMTVATVAIVGLLIIGRIHRLTYCMVFSAFGALHILVAVESLLGEYFRIAERIGSAFKNGIGGILSNWTFMGYVALMQLGIITQMVFLMVDKRKRKHSNKV